MSVAPTQATPLQGQFTDDKKTTLMVQHRHHVTHVFSKSRNFILILLKLRGVAHLVFTCGPVIFLL